MDEVRLKAWLEAYRQALSINHELNGHQYTWPISRLDEQVARVERALRERGPMSLAMGTSVVDAGKALGLKKTYRSLTAYLNGEPEAVYRA